MDIYISRIEIGSETNSINKRHVCQRLFSRYVYDLLYFYNHFIHFVRQDYNIICIFVIGIETLPTILTQHSNMFYIRLLLYSKPNEMLLYGVDILLFGK